MHVDNDIGILEQQAPICVEQGCDTLREKGVGILSRPVGDREYPIFIGPDLILVLLINDPRVVGCGILEAYADDPHAQGIELLVKVAVPATLFRSARRPSERKEPHHCGLPYQVFGASRLPIVVKRNEVRQWQSRGWN